MNVEDGFGRRDGLKVESTELLVRAVCVDGRRIIDALAILVGSSPLLADGRGGGK